MPDYDPVFLNAVQRVLVDEGGYVNNPSDPGGETNFGISKRSYPDLDIKNLTHEAAIEIYFNDFWLKPRFYALKGDVAAKVFNLGIVMGASRAVICLQRALRACSPDADPRLLPDDGDLTVSTILTANAVTNVAALLASLRSEAAGYFRITDALAHAAHGGDHPFLKGWLRRAYS